MKKTIQETKKTDLPSISLRSTNWKPTNEELDHWSISNSLASLNLIKQNKVTNQQIHSNLLELQESMKTIITHTNDIKNELDKTVKELKLELQETVKNIVKELQAELSVNIKVALKKIEEKQEKLLQDVDMAKKKSIIAANKTEKIYQKNQKIIGLILQKTSHLSNIIQTNK